MAKAQKKSKKKNDTNKSTYISRARAFLRRWLWRFGFLVIALLLLPYLLVLLYRFEFIKPVSTLMVAELLSGRSYQRDWVELDDIAPVLVQSVMMSEDGKYCSHSGVDWDALNIVVESALDGEATRGASTISMQTSKNLFLWGSRSFVRKALEIPLALFSDMIWGKERTMEIYLNIAQWGHGLYGIEAASKAYFGRGATKLSRAQAAILAVTLPNPVLRNAANPSQGMKRLARRIEERAKQSGAYIKCIYP